MVGMYVYGSLALGDFDSKSSDIDFVVVAAIPPTVDQFDSRKATAAPSGQSFQLGQNGSNRANAQWRVSA